MKIIGERYGVITGVHWQSKEVSAKGLGTYEGQAIPGLYEGGGIMAALRREFGTEIPVDYLRMANGRKEFICDGRQVLPEAEYLAELKRYKADGYLVHEDDGETDE